MIEIRLIIKDKFILLFILLLVNVVVCGQEKQRFSVYFKSNEYSLSVHQEKEIKLQFDSINHNYEIQNIGIYGFCDDIGTTAYNQVLATKRTESVKRIIDLHLKQSVKFTLKAEGRQELNPESKLNRDSIRMFNRRVDIEIIFSKRDSSLMINDTIKVGDKIVLQNILFVPGTNDYLPDSRPSLLLLLKTLGKYPNYKIQIQGHVYEAHGETNSGNQLSELRAKTVYDFLVKNGIPKERLSYVGFGGKYSLHKTPKEDRRVEIEIIEIE